MDVEGQLKNMMHLHLHCPAHTVQKIEAVANWFSKAMFSKGLISSSVLDLKLTEGLGMSNKPVQIHTTTHYRYEQLCFFNYIFNLK